MLIREIAVQNYRVLEDVTVILDSARTVIGGLNESGKSTLIDAAHRALFMRYKTGGEAQLRMISDRGGQPTVCVKFEAMRKEFSIMKRFSGINGTAVLTEVGGQTLKNDAAESRLAEILGVELAISEKESRHQWA